MIKFNQARSFFTLLILLISSLLSSTLSNSKILLNLNGPRSKHGSLIICRGFSRALANEQSTYMRGRSMDYIPSPSSIITSGTMHVEITHRRSDSIQCPEPHAEQGNPSSRWHTCRRTPTRCRRSRCTKGRRSSS